MAASPSTERVATFGRLRARRTRRLGIPALDRRDPPVTLKRIAGSTPAVRESALLETTITRRIALLVTMVILLMGCYAPAQGADPSPTFDNPSPPGPIPSPTPDKGPIPSHTFDAPQSEGPAPNPTFDNRPFCSSPGRYTHPPTCFGGPNP